MNLAPNDSMTRYHFQATAFMFSSEWLAELFAVFESSQIAIRHIQLNTSVTEGQILALQFESNATQYQEYCRPLEQLCCSIQAKWILKDLMR
ncbi:MAG: hypothetical protein K2X01_04615 [Cyanobacteria bacterium]|nr:hypothetical protein [Cyanobacteriota bacterium]